MNLTLESLRILDEIERRGSFAAAASALDRVPSALTYTVRKLEEDLDVLLFDRRGHRARLTSAGEELLNHGRHLLQAAEALEQRVKRNAAGWEAELRIVVDSVIPFERIVPLIAEFDREQTGTRLRITSEVLSGVWEALLTDRADMAIGAAYDGPDAMRMSSDFRTRVLGAIDWVFAVAPTHPLASVDGPLPADLIQRYRAVAAGDTGRMLPGMTAGLLNGQETLTVPSLQAKLAAQLAGLGCGHLPRMLAAPHIAGGRLVEKETVEARLAGAAHLAWRSGARGKAMKWFLARLSDENIKRQLLEAAV